MSDTYLKISNYVLYETTSERKKAKHRENKPRESQILSVIKMFTSNSIRK